MQDCPAEAVLLRFLDKALSAEQERAVDRHIASCSACQRALSRIASGAPVPFVAPVAAPPREQWPTFERFEVVGVLGAGGMGVVYRARDRMLHRDVAIKVIKADLAGEAQVRARFLREARALATLTDDHVVPIYTAGQAAGALYLVMPLLQGEPLSHRLRREGAQALAEVVRLGEQMARGLATVHAAGLGHRDIKPDLRETRVTAASLKVVGQFGLNGLSLPKQCKITDADAEHLRSMTRLMDLDLTGVTMSDRVLDVVQTLPGLRLLDLRRAKGLTEARVKQFVAERPILDFKSDFGKRP